MNIKLAEIGSIFQKGKRENMEDYMYPNNELASTDDRLFIVCDGMGGHAKGEVASKLACETAANFLLANEKTQVNELLEETFSQVQKSFDEYNLNRPESHGMGTTMVLAIIHLQGISVMHCGDSRLYHFRNGKIKWMTSDHSLVNEWVQQGLITKEQAHGHPRSNVITRAIQGSSIQKVKPDIHLLHDVLENDYILLCTDGVSNSLSDEEFENVMAKNDSCHEKIISIAHACRENSKDNYSAYLLKITTHG